MRMPNTSPECGCKPEGLSGRSEVLPAVGRSADAGRSWCSSRGTHPSTGQDDPMPVPVQTVRMIYRSPKKSPIAKAGILWRRLRRHAPRSPASRTRSPSYFQDVDHVHSPTAADMVRWRGEALRRVSGVWAAVGVPVAVDVERGQGSLIAEANSAQRRKMECERLSPLCSLAGNWGYVYDMHFRRTFKRCSIQHTVAYPISTPLRCPWHPRATVLAVPLTASIAPTWVSVRPPIFQDQP
jgi:hypothetical protein